MSRRDRDCRGRERDRDGRDPEPKRRRSGFDQLPAVDNNSDKKRGKTEREQPDPEKDLTAKSSAVTGDVEPEPKPKPKPRPNRGDEERKDPTQVPRSRSYFQHDERGNAGQVGRSFGRAAASDRQWRDSKDDRSERTTNKVTTYDSRRKDEKLQAKEDNNNVWRHDGFNKLDAEQPPPVRKRPAFSEKKITVDSENATSAAPEPLRRSYSDRPVSASEVREGRDMNDPRPVDRSEKPNVWDRKDAGRSGFPSRERFSGGGGSGMGYGRGRDRYNGKPVYRPSNTRADKWKHDLFEDANKSPVKKNEEDLVAKVEELLAS